MEDAPRPVIKGVFVRSHVKAVERVLGKHGVQELERRLGHSVDYSNAANVSVADEVAMLENIVDMFAEKPLSKRERSLEAGRLHFRDFRSTPLWNILKPIFGLSPKFLLMRSHAIAGFVFRNVEFISEDKGERCVKITMFNNDYPLEHFQGFFEEWLTSFGLKAKVDAAAHTRGRYEYTISWS